MRVTNSMLVTNFLNRLNTNLTKMDKIQGQMATNRKFAHISDDPISVIYSQQARYKLNRLAHYQENIVTGQQWLTQTETALMELNNVLKSAYEACIDASTDIKTEKDKENASEYIMQLRDQILQTLNSAFGDKYIFGGYNTTGYTDSVTNQGVPPFRVDSNGKLLYNECDIMDLSSPNDALIARLAEDVLTFDLAPGVDMPVTLNGIAVASYSADDNLYTLMDDFYKAVNSGAGADVINDFVSKLQAAQNHVLALTAEVGGRTNRLDMMASRYEQDEINYIQMKSDAEDADQAEIIMNYKMAEAVYKAALSSGAYIIQPTLMDFLK